MPEQKPALHLIRHRWEIRLAPSTMWTAAAIALTVLALVYVFTRAFSFIAVIFIAIVLAEGIRPAVDWLHGHRIPRPLGTLAVYLAIFVVGGGLGYVMARPLVVQIAAFINSLPTYIQDLQQWLHRVQEMLKGNTVVGQVLQTLQGQGGNLIGNVVNFLLGVPLALSNALFSLVLVLTIAFFWVNDLGHLRAHVIDLLPSALQDRADHILSKVGERLSWYVRGVLANMVFIAITHTVGLLVLGVPYPLLLGIFAGFTEVIPFVGPFIAGALSVAVALFTLGPLKAVEVLALVVLIQQFEANILVPNIMNRVVKLHPLVVVIAVILGGTLAGIVGAILAVPVAILVNITITDILVPLVQHRQDRPQKDPQAERQPASVAS